MSVAPPGREGVFTALASAPLFLAQLPTGAVSGALLQRYCPNTGQCTQAGGAPLAATGGAPGGPAPAPGACNGPAMWAIVTGLTLLSPLCLLVFGRWMRPSSSSLRGGGELGPGDPGHCAEGDPLLSAAGSGPACPRSPKPFHSP